MSVVGWRWATLKDAELHASAEQAAVGTDTFPCRSRWVRLIQAPLTMRNRILDVPRDRRLLWPEKSDGHLPGSVHALSHWRRGGSKPRCVSCFLIWLTRSDCSRVSILCWTRGIGGTDTRSRSGLRLFRPPTPRCTLHDRRNRTVSRPESRTPPRWVCQPVHRQLAQCQLARDGTRGLVHRPRLHLCPRDVPAVHPSTEGTALDQVDGTGPRIGV